MTLLKEKMQAAGVDTAGARLNALAVSALQECKGNVAAATETLFRKLSKEPSVMKEALLKPYLIARQADMQGRSATVAELGDATKATVRATERVDRRAPEPDRRRTVARIVESAVQAIKFKHMTSDGRDWADVGAHELAGMSRDGQLANVIRRHLGTLSNTQQVKPIGELMTAAKFKELLQAVESARTFADSICVTVRSGVDNERVDRIVAAFKEAEDRE